MVSHKILFLTVMTVVVLEYSVFGMWLLEQCKPVHKWDKNKLPKNTLVTQVKFEFKLNNWQRNTIFFYAQLQNKSGVIDVTMRADRLYYTITCLNPATSASWLVYRSDNTANARLWRHFKLVSTDNLYADVTVEGQKNISGKLPLTCANAREFKRYRSFFKSLGSHVIEIKNAQVDYDTCYTNTTIVTLPETPWSDMFFSSNKLRTSNKSDIFFDQ